METQVVSKKRWGKMPSQKKTVSETVKSVQNTGLFFCIEKPGELESVYEFVNKTKEELGSVSTLVFFLGKTKTEQQPEDIFWIDKKAFNLFGKMKSQVKSKLQEQTFDLLISFVSSNTKKCNDILEFIGARLKIGPKQAQVKQIVDVSIAVPDVEIDYYEFYQHIKFYMEKIKIQ